MYEQINALKKIGTQAASIGTLPGEVLVGTTVYTHCESVDRTAPHRNNACYFDPINMTDRKEWAQKMMDEKGVACIISVWCGTVNRLTVCVYSCPHQYFSW